tara:strand:+ start:156 stop:329 length:174 start_codon:yes stop_codon:yes gene_type:complete
MTEKECEHEWDDSQEIDTFLDIVDFKSEFVQIRVRCSKCGKRGLISAELEWSSVFWE